MKRAWLSLLALSALLPSVVADAGWLGRSQDRLLSDAITELDLERAQKLAAASSADTNEMLLERARLLVYLGDCESASALLSNPALTESKEGQQLAEHAKGCAHATAAGFVVEDAPRGIWLRLPQARDRIGAELGVDLPRPLRIDLVRDIFSLSAVTGLPLEAAETTGTLAVARFGRVIMISPRALPGGFHWEDTLAHELTHLLVTRASRDRAPLWLQEGVAKREETRWREPRPFDPEDYAKQLARGAIVHGRAIGLDKLGPSIAMLPTPEAASIAYAEVQSFVDYFIQEEGAPALRLLFTDLKGIGKDDPNEALRSVSGYDLGGWNRRWQKQLLDWTPPDAPAPKAGRAQVGDPRELVRRARLSSLLLDAGEREAALSEVGATDTGPSATFRFHRAEAELATARAEQAAKTLGLETEIDGVYGPWFSLRGRVLQGSAASAAERAFALGRALDPFAEVVACEGRFTVGGKPDDTKKPASAEADALCEAARRLPRD